MRMHGMNRLTSSAGVLALLDEDEAELKLFALQKLNKIVDVFWAEISEAVMKIEMLYEDTTFQHRELAALLASKVYYHLGSFEDSLIYALGAGSLFSVVDTGEYVETIISKCIDHYTKIRLHNAEAPEDKQKVIDPRLEVVVDRMFQRCLDDHAYKQALGIALETRRMDIFEKAILESDDVQAMLSYALKITLSLIQSRSFRNAVLHVLVKLYLGLSIPDYISVCQCFIFLDDPEAVAEILSSLIKGSDESTLMSYQIGFDLYESATQQFLQRIRSALGAAAPLPIVVGPPVTPTPVEADMETDATTEGEGQEKVVPEIKKDMADLSESEKNVQERITKLHTILGGKHTIELHLQFLIRNNKSDLLILKNTKDSVRNSVCHNATIIANGLMHCGTTSDQFLRDNLEWLARATNWAKFTATASLGVIHKGHEKDALQLMSTYLPKDGSGGSAYSEGGGLYALGLIHVNHGGTVMDYLLNQLKEATTDMVRHGGCLGLGLAAMGTARQDIYDQIKFNLYQDEAVTGEAAGIAMGLVMLGTKSAQGIEDMVAYAQETQHEKILRGLAVGISLTMFGRLEEADTLIESLSRDKDPILRRSAMYTVAMAYCGTGKNEAIRRLLHVAVSDVNDDVRRAAVMSLGFLLFRTPEQCPSVVSLLSESYNPHVRYGAAMALGIACSGSGLKEALALLEPMTNDPVNYVRQAALVASAMILVQHNDNTCSKIAFYRQLYSKVISDKHEDVMAKFGAILAQGIIDAGGRNMSISLQSRTGHTNMVAAVGMLVFCQFWYWFPLSHFIALALSPTCLIGLNADLRMPNINFRSNAKPSQFAYPPPLEEKKDKTKEKVETAILSITSKLKKKEGGSKKDQKMEVDEEKDDTTEKAEKTEKPEKSEKTDKEETKPEEKAEPPAKEEPPKEEQNFSMLNNPARIMKSQLKVIAWGDDARYHAVKDLAIGGIVMLKDDTPGEKEDIVENIAASGPKVEEEEEPAPPEPFEYVED